MKEMALFSKGSAPLWNMHYCKVALGILIMLCSSLGLLASDGMWTYLCATPSGTPISCSALQLEGNTTVLYVGTWGDGVFRWDGSSWTQMNNGLPLLYINTLVLDTQTSPPTLYASNGEVYKWDGSAWVDLAVGGHGGVNTLALDTQTTPITLYAGTEAGIRRWDGRSWSSLNDGLTEKTILSFAVDTHTSPSTIYAGSYSAGIFKLSGKKWHAINKDWRGEVVYTILVDRQAGSEIMYVGTESDGMFQRVMGRWSAINAGYPSGFAGRLVLDKQGERSTVYCSGDQGIYQWNGSIWARLDDGSSWFNAAILGIDERTTPPILYAVNDGSVYSINPSLPTVTAPIITGVSVLEEPFRLKLAGANFHLSAQVYVQGSPVPTIVYKDSSGLVAEGGSDLKGLLVPSYGYNVITVVNLDDGGTSAPFGFGH